MAITSILLKGIILGFSISVLIGPVGILCIRRSIIQGFWPGIFSGFGVALADALYTAVAAFGLTIISDFLLKRVFWLSLFGGFYLILVGTKSLLKNTDFTQTSLERGNLMRMLVSAFFLTIMNPMTILLFMAFFAGLNLVSTDISSNLALVFGVSVGSLIWWTMIAFFGSLLKYRITSAKLIAWINRISGIAIGLFGLVICIRTLCF